METLKLGLANLLLHKLRSLLTALGIIIGVAAVIFVVAIGEGNKRQALADIEKLGAKNIIVRSRKPPESSNLSSNSQSRMLSYGITEKDERIVREIQQRSNAIRRIVPLKLVGRRASNSDQQVSADIFGTMPELEDVTSIRVERGRYLTAADQEREERVAVIGAEVAAKLYPLQDPLESWITVHNDPNAVPFKVVGILAPVGLAGGAGTALVGRDLNFDIHIPISTARDQFGNTRVERRSGSFESTVLELSELYIEVREHDMVMAVAAEIQNVIDKAHGKKGDVTTIIPLELLEQAERTQQMFTTFLAFIAILSLLVGGIGIMNIMLASVTERTREIGIRRALGATRKHIVVQFLVETTTLSGVGGLLGVALGVSAVALLTFAQDLLPNFAKPFIATWSIVAGVVVALVVGVTFGIYPAVKASKQDPIHALRHD